jgi:hypothetical protein
MGQDWSTWDDDLSLFMHRYDSKPAYKNDWFADVATPMWRAHEEWKHGDRLYAHVVADSIAAPDWRAAVHGWMDRRLSK